METLYHGLANVKFEDICQFVNPGDFSCSFSIPTFVSCSTDPAVSRRFALHSGLSGHAAAGDTTDALLFKIQITKNQAPVAADISWISKFPHEKEIIVAPYQVFKLATVLDDITYGVPAAKKSDGTMVKNVEEAVAAIESSVTRTSHGNPSVVEIKKDDGTSFFYDDPKLGGTGATSWQRDELDRGIRCEFTEVPCRIAPPRGVCANRRHRVSMSEETKNGQGETKQDQKSYV